MSTRQTIYLHMGNKSTPGIHIYRELLDGKVRMEISTGWFELIIPLPADLQKRMGIEA